MDQIINQVKRFEIYYTLTIGQITLRSAHHKFSAWVWRRTLFYTFFTTVNYGLYDRQTQFYSLDTTFSKTVCCISWILNRRSLNAIFNFENHWERDLDYKLGGSTHKTHKKLLTTLFNRYSIAVLLIQLLILGSKIVNWGAIWTIARVI